MVELSSYNFLQYSNQQVRTGRYSHNGHTHVTSMPINPNQKQSSIP